MKKMCEKRRKNPTTYIYMYTSILYYNFYDNLISKDWIFREYYCCRCEMCSVFTGINVPVEYMVYCMASK